jgi:hypothetical protein
MKKVSKRFGQETQGSVDMVTCLQAYIEYGINLQRGHSVSINNPQAFS